MSESATASIPQDPAEVIARHSRSFSLAARFLPVRVRHNVKALYAWCRQVDDCVDRAESSQAAEMALQEFRNDLTAMERTTHLGRVRYQQTASYWLEPLIVNRQIDLAHAFDLLDGMQMDLRGIQVRGEADLRRYCYHAAGCVGLMLSSLLGARNPAARRHAIALGVAMQMTNIARDVKEDSESGRCYVPGLNVDSVSIDHQETRSAVKRLLRLAEGEYQLASKGIAYLPRDCQRAIRVASAAYREIGREILRQDATVWKGRTVVPRGRLLIVVLSALVPKFNASFLKPRIGRTIMPSERSSNARVRQSLHAVYLGISLTSFMAAALFCLVFVNPKDESYGLLPVIYAGSALVVGLIANLLARKQEAYLSR